MPHVSHQSIGVVPCFLAMDFKDARSILRRCPKAAMVTSPNNFKSGKRFSCDRGSRTITALSTLGGGVKSLAGTSKAI